MTIEQLNKLQEKLSEGLGANPNAVGEICQLQKAINDTRMTDLQQPQSLGGATGYIAARRQSI